MSELNLKMRAALSKEARKAPPKSTINKEGEALLDSASSSEGVGSGSMQGFELSKLKLDVAAAIQGWTETEESDLDSGETMSDRLMMLLVGVVDEDKDGELSEDEEEVFVLACELAWDYISSTVAVPEEDLDKLLNDWDNDTAINIRELLVAKLPDGEEAEKDIDDFAFSSGDQDALFDSIVTIEDKAPRLNDDGTPMLDSAGQVMLDAAYRKKIVIRKGKKVRINKRISGKVRLSAKQKVALRKARVKAHSATAKIRRLKSMRLRRKMSL